MQNSKFATIVVCASLALTASSWTAAAQDSTSPVREKVSDAEMKRLVGRLKDYLSEDESSTKRIGARDSFEKEVAKLEKKHGIGSFLRDTAFLGELLTAASVHSHDKRASKGRVTQVEAEETIAGDEWVAPYALWIPRSYRGEKPLPAIVGLHPEGKDGKWYLNEILKDDSLRDNFIIVCPTLAEGERFHEREGFYKLLGLVLNQASNKYFIDKDRIFLDGYGQGGESAWILASRFRDLFAGVVARSAAFDATEVQSNLRYIPAMAVVGSDDASIQLDAMRKVVGDLKQASYDITLNEVAGTGDSNFADRNGEIGAWLSEKRRSLFPNPVTVALRNPMFGRGYWIGVLRTETATEEGSDQRVQASLQASYDRAENKIEITSENIYKIEVFVNDDIVDLDRPFTVFINGQKMFDGVKQRDWRFMIDRYLASGDPTRVFTASLELDIPQAQ